MDGSRSDDWSGWEIWACSSAPRVGGVSWRKVCRSGVEGRRVEPVRAYTGNVFGNGEDGGDVASVPLFETRSIDSGGWVTSY